MGSTRTGSRPETRAHRLPSFERTPTASRGHRTAQLAIRAAVLVSLLAATVVVPFTQGAFSVGSPMSSVLGQGELPSTVSALSAQAVVAQVPAALSPAGALSDRDMEAASRGLNRGEILPGCNGLPPVKSAPNGNVPDKDLCTLWDGKTKVRADFAYALVNLNDAYVAKYGVDLCITDGYRTLAQQRLLKNAKGSMVATPGKSNHGLGLAVDFCKSTYAGARYTWLRQN
ncbi:MAG: M15 family metallopeptidase, partial [Micrococcales bacterium]|nr:M15 family metallopeptidase [Micrococcales bacterium]